MKNKLKNIVTTVLFSAVILLAVSCKKKEMKKVIVDNQFALALFNDTISIKDILGMMDSTTNNWLKVRNDSLFAYYADSVKDVLKAGDLLGNLEDVNFNTTTSFTMPMCDLTNNHDTIIDVAKFMTVPFNFDGFDIEEVIIRSGMMSFGFDVNLESDLLRRIELYSNQILSPTGDTLKIGVDYPGGSDRDVNLANYRIVPENDIVAFGARITLHIESGVYPGGTYECVASGGLTAMRFKTVYALVTKNLDSIYSDYAEIDFGINGLSGTAYLPVPKIMLTYRNTFGLSALSDVTRLEFYSSKTGLVTDLLATDHWVETVGPTNGEYRSKRIGNFVDNIDVLANYTRLDFDGRVTMAMPGDKISISDTSSIDVIANIEMPLSFKISDLRYADTVEINFEGNGISVNLLDSLDFYLDFNNRIPLEVDVQALFMKNDVVIDSLFDSDHIIQYNDNPYAQGYNTVKCTVTDDKMRNVLKANKMILRLGASTEGISDDPVMMRESNSIALRMRMMTYSSEIDIDNFMNN